MRLLSLWLSVWLVPLVTPPSVRGEEASDAALAFLGEQAITQSDVDFMLGRVGARQQVELADSTKQQAIQLFAQQRQALQTLRKLGLGAEGEAISRSIEASLVSPEQSTKEFVNAICQRFGISEETYLEQVAFRLSWRRYLAKHLTQENLNKHFHNQLARFDGTRFEIWLASLPVPAGTSEARDAAATRLIQFSREASSLASQDLLDRAKRLEIEFKPQHWIRGFGDTDPEIVTQLLGTEVGQITPVIHTASGVHLAALVDIEAGESDLLEVKDEVRAHMLVFLLEHLAQQSEQTLPLSANLDRSTE